VRALLGLGAVAVAFMTAASAHGTTTVAPSVRPAQIGVPVFIGQRFHPLSQVKVTLMNGARTFTRLVRASPSGGFSVRFTLAAVDPCRGTLSVTAVDGRGTRARWKRQCRPPSETDPYPVS
jgi:hypothetical protein